MADTIIKQEQLLDFSTKVLEKAGMTAKDAKIVAEVLTTNDMWGVSSHGTILLKLYIKQVIAGGANPRGQLKIVKEGPSWALIDGNRGLGVLTAYKAMKIAINKAKKSGIGMVSVRGSNHFAGAGYYAMMCPQKNMIGISMSNADPTMSPPGTKGRIMGNNPFSYAVPAGKDKAVFFDVAMSVMSGGKIKGFESDGKKLPENCIVDKYGNPTIDPAVFRQEGSLLPFAMHKGYGFAVMVECLAAVLSGAGILDDNVNWDLTPDHENNIGHMFIAIDVEKFISIDIFKNRMDDLIERLRNAPKAEGVERIYLPGETELEKEEKARTYGFTPGGGVLESLESIGRTLGLEKSFKKLINEN